MNLDRCYIYCSGVSNYNLYKLNFIKWFDLLYFRKAEMVAEARESPYNHVNWHGISNGLWVGTRMIPVYCLKQDPYTRNVYFEWKGDKPQIVHYNPYKPYRWYYLKHEPRWLPRYHIILDCYIVKSKSSAIPYPLTHIPTIEA